MSVQSFIPQVWEAKLLAGYHKGAVAELLTTKPTKIEGNKIVFNRVGAGNVKDYTGTVAWDEVNTTPIELNMDQKKYFAFSVDDVDRVQVAGDLIDAYTEEEAAAIKEVIDTFVLGLYTGAHADNVIGDDATPIALDKLNVYDYIVDLGTKLNKKKVPKAGRFVVINSDVLGLLSKDDRFTRNPVVLENGVVEGQVINGMQVVVSEELATVSGKLKILALSKSAIGFGKQIDQTEAIRLPNAFADGVRGLVVYGGEVIRPEALAVLTATIVNQ
ncbi:phage capsid protein [Heyndrickxia oleronia]|jgi:hypothetical protein|uniref:phage capsid protein n=1 Tax=Heyndrickxia oleronia TaxID=38875 RepID=UPI0024323EDA|nr:phage capsid protein [Heyndrickxia oleronia]MCI1590379.1 phage capsid protein [Heyndrickxia oleronia]MCI1611359.1 phage capsid protein [Heyndrickxia oleronia]MCI1742802.1 phage capsid protein [Heyndrickxia oleronia]MCI1763113.1 phage capsid protein [Heyndrickxia oleronia]